MKSLILAVIITAAANTVCDATCVGGQCSMGPIRSVVAAQPVRTVIHTVTVNRPVRSFVSRAQPVRRVLGRVRSVFRGCSCGCN